MENPKLYEIAKLTCHSLGLPWTDPRTGETFPAPKGGKRKREKGQTKKTTKTTTNCFT
jgi:hypothetical protein